VFRGRTWGVVGRLAEGLVPGKWPRGSLKAPPCAPPPPPLSLPLLLPLPLPLPLLPALASPSPGGGGARGSSASYHSCDVP